MADTVTLSRRNFMVVTGAAGLTIGFTSGCSPAETPDASSEPIPEINAWVHIAPDNTVTVRIARSEMGQGTLTGLSQLVAEELECDWDKVVTEYPTPGQSIARERAWGSFATGGSQGVRGSHQYVREGGAAARLMLIEAAANEWGVSPSECSVEKGVITHAASGNSTTYGAVASAAAELAPPLEVTLKDPLDWKLIGQPLPRLDTVDKVTGKQIYGADITLPGMLLASVKQCPVKGGTLASYDADAVSGMPGVRKVVKLDDTAVAVIGDTWWQAHSALQSMPIEWDDGENGTVDSAQINAFLEEGLTADEAFVGNMNGDVAAAFNASDQVIEATYNYPFQNHATMEPMNATALWTEDKCEVWCPTQNGESAIAVAAAAAELPIEQCEIYKIHLGGGFGRRAGSHDFVDQAVKIAKQMPGTPIKLQWSREEDMAQGMYHPITQGRMRGGLDAAGNLTGLHIRISGQSILAGILPQALRDGVDYATFQGLLPEGLPGAEDQVISYGFPNLLVDHAMRNPHLRPGFWRGVNVNQNAIYIECFLDEMAYAAGRDPLDFRLSLMDNHPKNAAVLKAAAERSGWGSDDGKARGLAVCYAFGSYVAACAEVSVDDNGRLKMHRIVAATDPGYAVNPQQIEAQVEGSFVYGLSALLYGEINVENGAVVEQNFDTYNSLRIDEMPDVETIIMPSGGFWGGVGEPTIAVAAPAVLNAIYAATGKRVRQLPLKNVDLRAV
ncbi:MAG: molybdopterin cofactor-binding domain-containing protein [Pseudomonadota bacterium]